MNPVGRKPLPIVYATEVLQTLDAIWNWNAQTHNRERAARYTDYLLRRIDTLRGDPYRGRKVESRPELRYIQIRRRSHGHGHIAVYRVDSAQISVLHIFHTAQNWQATLAAEP